MIFLIEYPRKAGHLLTFERFEDSRRLESENRRLELELSLHRRGIDHEVVILEAASEKALRRTHRRYFETATEMVESTQRELMK